MMKKSVLIIDDSNSMRKVIAFTLGQEGYDIIEACDGLDALSKLEQNTVNIIICDVNMPNMDGIDFLKNCKKNLTCDLIPVIMLTTEKGIDLVNKAKKLGASAWMVKPFDCDKLLHTISTVSH